MLKNRSTAILESAFTGESGDGRVFVAILISRSGSGQKTGVMNRFMIKMPNNSIAKIKYNGK